jgi:acylphosphatase
MKMKIKVRIKGPRVHNVGYRSVLMTAAFHQGLSGFNARNRSNGPQEVVVLIEGDDEAVEDFRNSLEITRPENAEVSEIACEPYDGMVTSIDSYALIFSADQMNKAIPILQRIEESNERIEKSSERMEKNTEKIDKNTSPIDEIAGNTAEVLGEVGGLREDFRMKFEDRLMRMENDMKKVKSKLGIR